MADKTIAILGPYGSYNITAFYYKEYVKLTKNAGMRSVPFDPVISIPKNDKFSMFGKCVETSGSRAFTYSASFQKGTPENKYNNHIRLIYLREGDDGRSILRIQCDTNYVLMYASVGWIQPDDGTTTSINPNCKVYDLAQTAYDDIPTTVDVEYRTDSLPQMTYSNMPIRSIASAFSNCTNLLTVSSIPSNISKSVRKCFENCTSLSGNILVNNDPQYWSNIFDGTVHDIFIINGGNANASTWRNISNIYSNIHYEADDIPIPTITNFTATRVAANGDTTFNSQGKWAYINARINIGSTFIPDGWSNALANIVLKKDGSDITPWDPSTITTFPYIVETWVNVGDLRAHDFSLEIIERVLDSNSVLKRNLSSEEFRTPFLAAYALVDYYHDPITGLEGLAFGKYAERANFLEVEMPMQVNQNLYAMEDFYLGLDTHAGSGTDYEITTALTALGWTDVIVQE